MSSFLRRFLFDPGDEVLLDIESINILDLEPPSNITGVGTGTVLLVGEFENGDFEEPAEVASAGDLSQRFGGFGYTYAGVVGNNPCARSRKADGAIVAEYWNGNAAAQLNGKRFKRLVVCRVDTSIGSVELRREAFVTGAEEFRYNLEPSQILALDIGSGPVSATFSATAATVTSGAGTYPNGFTGGETLTLGYDDADDFVVTFLAGDTTRSAVISRINAAAGFTFASANVVSTEIDFTSIKRGSTSQVRIVAGSTGVLAALGLTAANTLGTGNVRDIDAVSFQEVKQIVEAAVAGTTVRQDSRLRLRISKDYVADGDYIQVTSATTATALGFSSGDQGSNDGVSNIQSGAQTFNVTHTGTLTLGVGEDPDFPAVTVTSGDNQATVMAAINAAVGYTMASAVDSTHMLLRSRSNGESIRVSAGTSGVLSDLGLSVQEIAAPIVIGGLIPAGTVLVTDTATEFVTMQDVLVTAGSEGPYTVPIRHALDDGTGTSATAGDINSTKDAPDLGAFNVVNPANTSAALTETQIDAKYVTALAATAALDSVASEANIIFSARQSNTIRRALRSNALDASANGCFGRVAIIRPPLGTLKDRAKSTIAQPGVGAYRDQRVIYTYPGLSTFVPPIALRGLAGGTGFTADGIIDVGADGFLASICSQLPPEENPGQRTTFTDGAVGLESSANAKGFDINDYKAFKRAGICAPRIDSGVVIFQSGCTSVDPLVQPGLKNIARRRMADFIEDSLSLRLKDFGKKLATRLRRKAIMGEIRSFAELLLSRKDPSGQRIAGYTLHDRDNTPDGLASGLYRITFKVRNIASLDSITVGTTVGENVEVDEILPELKAA